MVSAGFGLQKFSDVEERLARRGFPWRVVTPDRDSPYRDVLQSELLECG